MSTSVLYDAPGPEAKRRSLIIGIVGGAIILALVGWMIYQANSNNVFNDRWQVLVTTLPGNSDYPPSVVWQSVLGGLWATLKAALIAAPLALIFGTLLLATRLSAPKPVAAVVVGVIELFRGLPLILVMLAFFLIVGGEAIYAVVGGLVLYNMAIFSEILRAGIVALPKGQREASMAIGMGRFQTFRLILLPQAVKSMLPSLVSQLVVLLKDSSLGYVIGYVELLRTVQNLGEFFGEKYQLPLFAVGAVMFIIINVLLSRLAVWLEKRSR
ncbi:amino acid ABC transporter permease [Micrococcales bacterium 31B]|nr:amino acid ABC transporter permease [Micrococcales bacterium 31B]